jgi:hypothetical protein
MCRFFLYNINILQGFSLRPAPTRIENCCSHLKHDIKNTDRRFAKLNHAKRIWAISAIHGELDRLITLHDNMSQHIRVGDRLVYTGNYMGYGHQSKEVIDELLTFRRAMLSRPGMISSDFVYLRGAQEEMWQKLIQLQFCPDPSNTLLWMLGNGLENTLHAYGLCPDDGVTACRQGMFGISAWTKKVKAAIATQKGHDVFSAQLVRAAFTAQASPYPMLFVNAGIDINKNLTEQGDNFWWGSNKFDNINQTYAPFEKIIRGYDPNHKGIDFNCVKATIDGGCGFGGSLVCAVFNQDGSILDTLAC